MQRSTPSMASLVALALCLAGLLLRAASAAAPPTPAEVPGPGPLFGPDHYTVDAREFAMHAFAGMTGPARPLGALAVLYAGGHDRVQAWQLEGVMTGRQPRAVAGTATLVLQGLSPNPLGSVVTLRAGDQLMCWSLRDTDRFLPLPPQWLRSVEDGKPFVEGRLENEDYARIIALANFTSDKAFRAHAKNDVTTIHLNTDPAFYRGDVIAVEGHLKRIHRHPPLPEATEEGVNDHYEAWIFPETIGALPVVFVFTEWPEGLPRSLLGQTVIKERIRVQAAGYFFKKYLYPSGDKAKTEKTAPLLIGHTLAVPGPRPKDESFTAGWAKAIVYVVPAMFIGLIFVIVGLTYWYRRQDDLLRQRLRRAREGDFVPPPPDAVPVAAPVAAPRAAPAHAAPSRHRLPGLGGRRGDRSSPDEGSESGGKPPDDQTGA